MKKMSTILAAALLCLAAKGEVNYQTIPLPQSITLDASGKTTALVKGQVVAYPAENALMKRNAEFAQEFLGLVPQPEVEAKKKAKKKDVAPVRLALGLASDNPDAYQITVDKKGILVQGASESGVFYGIQTLRKSIEQETGDSVLLPWVVIQDAPRFQYRGAMLDCARHFFPADFIKTFIDILALHGVNKFHWHLTDDQGWRLEVKALPELVAKGSHRPYTIVGPNVGAKDLSNAIFDGKPEGGFYSREQIRDIVAYAAERYITIIPEIDLPGHMVAALTAYPELGCTGGPYVVKRHWGIDTDVLCAGNPKTLEFIKTVLSEVCELFPSKFIHIGGDECPRKRWEKCPKCQAKMKELKLEKEAQLQTYINQEVENFLATKGRELIGWDEIVQGGLSENATVMYWRGGKENVTAAQKHHRVIVTNKWFCYFDYYQLANHATQPMAFTRDLPLSKVYSHEPIPEELTAEEAKYILGAQCNVWSEYIASPDHVMYMLLPRLAAISEVQWTQPEKKDFEQFKPRLAEFEKMYHRLGYKYCTNYE
ncbi:MAG: beta-N-acetylhexosaminidase [Bacteroidaceae bacterium]|nr:beta-N-acetylhexosaminidase [Bacteroidaceae bacterium]